MAATVTKIDYLAKAAEAADKLYPKIVSLRCTHASGAKTYAQLLSAKKVTCASSASIAYQLAGILASGDVIGHQDAVGGSDANILRKKSTVAKAMTGVANLPRDKVDVVWVGKKYADLPAKYQKKGVLYVQDSNVCICAGGGAIYSCNGAKGSQLDSKGHYKANKITGGYAFSSPILVAVIPKVKEVPTVTKLHFMDVSQFNPTVDWAKAAKAVDGAIIRAGYRGTSGGLKTDPMFLKHIQGAISAGVKRIGVYWWTAHTSVAQAEGDAAYLAQLLKPYKMHINFRVWLDSEPSANPSAFNRLSAAARTTYAKAFLAAMTAAGYAVGIYSSDSYFISGLQLSRLSGYPLWVAKWSAIPPKQVKSYVGWQYTDKGKVSGVTGKVDRSYFYEDFVDSKSIEEVHDMDTLRKGDKGQQVRALQKLLGGIAVDGVFGAATKAAVEAYQRQYQLSVDGVVGAKTWDALLK